MPYILPGEAICLEMFVYDKCRHDEVVSDYSKNQSEKDKSGNTNVGFSVSAGQDELDLSDEYKQDKWELLVGSDAMQQSNGCHCSLVCCHLL